MGLIHDRNVGPSDCILAFGIPLTKTDFLRDLDASSGKDFVQSYVDGMTGILPDALWDLFYKPQAELAQRIAGEVSTLGVRVIHEMKLSQLPTVLSSAEVVAIVAHWRGSRFKVSDLLDVHSFVGKLIDSNDKTTTILRESFSIALMYELETLAHNESAPFDAGPLLVRELNGVLENKQLYQTSPAPGETAYPEQAEGNVYLNRLTLENYFPQTFRPGHRFELSDGLHSIDAVVEQVPGAYAGILDLTSCNSVILGEAIKHLRRGCLILTNERPARLDFRLILFQNVMRALGSRKAPYIDTVIRLRKQLIKTRG